MERFCIAHLDMEPVGSTERTFHLAAGAARQTMLHLESCRG